MDREELLFRVMKLLEEDEDFPEFDQVKFDDDGSATFMMRSGEEFMIMVVDITE